MQTISSNECSSGNLSNNTGYRLLYNIVRSYQKVMTICIIKRVRKFMLCALEERNFSQKLIANVGIKSRN